MGKQQTPEQQRAALRRSVVRRMTTVAIVMALLILFTLATDLLDVYPPFRTLLGLPLLHAISISGVFAACYLLLACLLSIKTARKEPTPPKPRTLTESLGSAESMTLQGILLGEFAYARETASQAMEERRSVTNFYLLIVGGTLTGVVALLSTLATRNSLALGAVAALWLVCLVGLLTLFSIISLRLAWASSANAMAHIKAFYLINAERLGATPEILQSAFSFQVSTTPAPGTHWNVNHFAILLIALLDSAAYLVGMILMGVVTANQDILILCLIGSALSVPVFLAHLWAYDLSLIWK